MAVNRFLVNGQAGPEVAIDSPAPPPVAAGTPRTRPPSVHVQDHAVALPPSLSAQPTLGNLLSLMSVSGSAPLQPGAGSQPPSIPPEAAVPALPVHSKAYIAPPGTQVGGPGITSGGPSLVPEVGKTAAAPVVNAAQPLVLPHISPGPLPSINPTAFFAYQATLAGGPSNAPAGPAAAGAPFAAVPGATGIAVGSTAQIPGLQPVSTITKKRKAKSIVNAVA